MLRIVLFVENYVVDLQWMSMIETCIFSILNLWTILIGSLLWNQNIFTTLNDISLPICDPKVR